MSLLSTSLQISGYKDAKFFSWLGDYTVQLNPSKLSVSVAQNEKNQIRMLTHLVPRLQEERLFFFKEL